MKALILSSIVALFSFGFSNSTVTVVNHTSKDLGTVRLNYLGGYTDLSVPSQGTYYAQVGGTVSSITLNQQTIISPSGVVTLPTGAKVDVEWTSSVTIEIFDDTEVLSPAP